MFNLFINIFLNILNNRLTIIKILIIFKVFLFLKK